MGTAPPRTIFAFGHFDLEGGRSWAIRTGLTRHGFRIELCRTEVKGVMGKYRDLFRQWRSKTSIPDAIYVPFLGHWILPLAWWLARTRRIPLIFDAFLSLYDTEVHDRKRLRPWHPKAWFLWCTDWLCCALSDVVLLDTAEHKDYFARTFGVRQEKIFVLPIGCRTDLFKPSDVMVREARNDTSFLVEFHGTFIPLQGIETILAAALALQLRGDDIQFQIIGKGQTYAAMRVRTETLHLKNVEFTGAFPMEKLPSCIRHADVCLGIFGTTDKADRVIPNKAYEILACGKPLITGRTTAAQRVLTDGENAVLTEPGNPEELASAILRLKNDAELCLRIGENGKKLTEERFLPEKIVEPLAEYLVSSLRAP